MGEAGPEREAGLERAAGPERRRRTPAVVAWLRLLRVSRKIGRLVGAQIRGAGLTQGQFAMLAHAGAHEGMAQQELAEALALTEGNVCQLLDKMEERGLLRRRQEGRSNRVYLTDEGHALFARVVPAHEALIADQFAALSVEQQAHLHRLLRDLDRSLDLPRRSQPAAVAGALDTRG